jgi:hypothetical protein
MAVTDALHSQRPGAVTRIGDAVAACCDLDRLQGSQGGTLEEAVANIKEPSNSASKRCARTSVMPSSAGRS